jgi:hypothetical protein
VQDLTGRFGATVLPMQDGSVMVLGGVAGIGGDKPADWLLSSGALVVPTGAFDAAICADHQPLAAK